MPPTRRRPYTPRMPPQERRKQLLDAAIEIIARDGYAGVSIDAIEQLLAPLLGRHPGGVGTATGG